ncbi:MAG: Gfo/Idh/MocA family oxidoreductase [Planctomycetia bacterium]|nr:Gfo/Idh/MocA family oxidoreductase [Planctomycetia bacterium]
MSSINRRGFLISCLALGTATAFCPSVLSARGANERLRVGVIGLGNRGSLLLNTLLEMDKIDVVAIADPDVRRLEPWQKRLSNAKACADMRKIFADPDVDAVVIATCNHWHALAAILAMEAGKDVYVEKPLALSFWEGRQVVNAARKYKRVCQIGTQMRTDRTHAEIKKFLHEEKSLGKILAVRINRFAPRKGIGLRPTPLPIPNEIDYNLWLGPAQECPLYRDKLHYDWHWMWNTGNGETGNWGAHLIDDCRNDILCDRIAFPKRILTAAGRVGYNDAGETPNTLVTLFDTGEIPIAFGISNLPAKNDRRSAGTCFGPKSGYVVWCEGGRYEKFWGGGTAFDLDGKVIKEFACETERSGVPLHLKNFCDAVYDGTSANLTADIEVGYHTSAWYNAANAAYRVGHDYSKKEALEQVGSRGPFADILAEVETHLDTQGVPMDGRNFKLSSFLELDAATERFVGPSSVEANAVFEPHFREPFVVPEVKM